MADSEKYTPDEEALIWALRNRPVREIVGELVAAGFRPRLERTVRRKRDRMKAQNLDSSESTTASLGAQVDQLAAAEASLDARRSEIRAELGRKRRELASR